MADLVITAASVIARAGSTIEKGYNAGATLTASQGVYLDESVTPPLWKLCDANGAAGLNFSVTTVRAGLTLHASLSGQPVAVLTAGPITIGATVAIGTTYVFSATPGGIAPSTDLVSGWYVTHVGIATTAAIIQVCFNLSGVAVP